MDGVTFTSTGTIQSTSVPSPLRTIVEGRRSKTCSKPRECVPLDGTAAALDPALYTALLFAMFSVLNTVLLRLRVVIGAGTGVSAADDEVVSLLEATTTIGMGNDEDF